MVTFNDIQAQLVSAGTHTKGLGVRHIKQLARVLAPKEQIMSHVKGWHKGSVVILCATDKRMLVLSKYTEKGDYDQVDYRHITETFHKDSGLSATITFYLDNKRFEIKSWRVKKLKEFYAFAQRHIIYVQEQNILSKEIDRLSVASAKTTRFETRSWRNLMRRVGNTSIIN